MGASHCINSSNSDPEVAIKEALAGQALDVFIDNTGSPEIIELGYRLSAHNGRVILVGVPRKGNNVNLYSLPLHFGKVITGSHGGESHPEKDITRFLRLQQHGKLQLQQLVSAHYPLEKINDAIRAMRDGDTSGRVMIRFEMRTQILKLSEADDWKGCVLAYGHSAASSGPHSISTPRPQFGTATTGSSYG